MRNNSVVVTVVIVLLNASCILCDSLTTRPSTIGRDEGTNQQKHVRPDTPVEILDKYLIDQVKSSDWNANIKAALKYLKMPKLLTDVKEFVELIVQIDQNDVCEADNIAKKSEAIRKLRHYELQDRAKSRLYKLLQDSIHQSSEVCFVEFEKQWLANEHTLDKHFMKYLSSLKNFDADGMNQADPMLKEIDKPRRDETRMLWVALERYFERRPEAEYEKLTDKELAMAESEHPDLFRWAKQKVASMKFPKKAKTVKHTFNDVLKSIEDNFYKPCQELVEQAESKSILEPIGQLAYSVDEINLDHIKPIEGDKVLTFQWAARYYACKWQLTADKNKFAQRVFETIKK